MPDEPFKLTCAEALRVKDVVLVAASTGQLSGNAPIRLAESLISALALVSRSADCPAPNKVQGTAIDAIWHESASSQVADEIKGGDISPAPPSSLPLPDRLAIARRWLLGRDVHPLQERAMGADRWQSEPPAEQRMRAAVAAVLCELAGCVEKHGVQIGLAQALLVDKVSDKLA